MNLLPSSKAFTLAFISIVLLCFSACKGKRSDKPRVLVFSKTAGYHHASIPAGNAALMKLGSENGFDVDTTTNADWFIEDTLQKYAAVVFLNTTDTSDDLLNHYQQAEFERYIQSGGGFAGVHAAADAEYHWPWYNRLVGASFLSHPAQQNATILIVDSSVAATKGLPQKWNKWDEWYNYKNINPDIKVLAKLDESSYEGGKNGDNHPIAWYHDYDGGRAFYTGLGHTDETYSDSLFLKHLLGGIQYAIGDNNELDYDKAVSQKVPEENRFVRTTLTEGTLFEPTEIAVLPNLDVLISQRRGELMLYSDKSKSVKQVGLLNVYYKTDAPGVNAEEGLLGMAADPNFKSNNYIYLYYSPEDTSVNRLSRFTFKNDTLDMKSEKVILQLYSQRNICCHTGGSIAFGKDNLLYVSTGDNSTPFDEKGQPYVSHGYAPLDQREGHEQYDARRSSGNTNDLRGKILRIRIKDDGTYEIPDGNLFPKGTDKARPEIFVMGNRNPYRISVDKRTGFLYWGEVGPDARVDSFATRGPRGYDEVNQARKAGYFGWPLFVGNNYPYREYNYGNGTSDSAFDPAKPQNTSRNNTGLTTLPPAQPAYIYYPYGNSKEFPQVGSGGRNAMAGPVYYTDDYPKETRFPDYYNNKFFMYDWVRGWIKVVTMEENGDFNKMEPFMSETKFAAPIDMEAGPDGRLYILEYGSGWFSKNADAGLVRIDYVAGNRPPKVGEVVIDKSSGKLPYNFTAEVGATDPEGDALTYIWSVGDKKIETKEPKLNYTIQTKGDYLVSVQVMDDGKASSNSKAVEIYAGNEQPKVDIVVEGNQSFYFPGKPVNYKVNIKDEGDSINMSNLYVSTDYIHGFDRAGQSMGHQVVSAVITGKSIMQSSDCKTCHKIDEPSIGPSFKQVADKYAGQRVASSYLIDKVLKGGSGVWGENAMPAHPNMKENDAKQIITYVLSLGRKDDGQKSLPPTGKIMPDASKGSDVLSLRATYTDNGGAGLRPLPASGSVFLRSSRIDASDITDLNGFNVKDSAGTKYLMYPQNDGWIKISQVDLTSIKGIELSSFGLGSAYSFKADVMLDNANSTSIGGSEIKFGSGKTNVIIPVSQAADGKLHDVYIQFKASNTAGQRPLLSGVRFVQ